MQLPCYADRLTSVLCSFSSLVIRNNHRVAMYFHAPCGVVLYFFVCKLYANKEKNVHMQVSFQIILILPLYFLYTKALHSEVVALSVSVKPFTPCVLSFYRND